MDNYKRPAFRRIGSKYRALEHIIPVINSYIKKDSCFVDAFCGTGVVSLNVSHTRYHIVNDADRMIVGFYRAIRDQYDELEIALKSLHPASRVEFYDSKHWIHESDPLLRLAKWYYLIACSYLGRGVSWAVNYENQQPDLHTYLNYWPAIRYRINTWQLECLDWRDAGQRAVLLKYDNPRTVWYFDPPYVGTEGMSWSEEDMESLLDFCGRAVGCVCLSHYPLNQIDQEVHWDEKITYEIHASAGLGDKIIENLWVRF